MSLSWIGAKQAAFFLVVVFFFSPSSPELLSESACMFHNVSASAGEAGTVTQTETSKFNPFFINVC